MGWPLLPTPITSRPLPGSLPGHARPRLSLPRLVVFSILFKYTWPRLVCVFQVYDAGIRHPHTSQWGRRTKPRGRLPCHPAVTALLYPLPTRHRASLPGGDSGPLSHSLNTSSCASTEDSHVLKLLKNRTPKHASSFQGIIRNSYVPGLVRVPLSGTSSKFKHSSRITRSAKEPRTPLFQAGAAPQKPNGGPHKQFPISCRPRL